MPQLNRLSKESSPYLLQHAANPVDWYPWGEEALERARRENLPILASIGYSACHWCHVMEHESFEDPAVADFMNEHFVNIKIDREERPDLDHIFMDAVQALTGSGGWPLNVFLTPDGRPFYGGTYFPPQKAFNRASWMDVLTFINDAWNNQRNEVLEQAQTLTDHIADNSSQLMKGPGVIQEISLQEAYEALMKQADTEWGGFGKAPKFPQTMSLRFLLMYHHFFQQKEALEQVERSVRMMCRGGLFDHLGGGFARYSTDEKWLAPHFEKMLYDNALLLILLCELFQVTGDDFYRNFAEYTLDFLEREMKSSEGGYYAALDADSEGVEGKYYVWSHEEFTKILGKDSELAARWFGVSPEGNWEHTNILHLPFSEEEFREKYGDVPSIHLREKWKKKLLETRERRIRPGTDDKIILGWNALLVTAFCKAYGAFGDEIYRQRAVSLYAFLETRMKKKNWHHTYKQEARIPAFLDDLSYLVQAMIMLQEITSSQEYLRKAFDLVVEIEQQFGDEEGIFFYYSRSGQPDLVVRKKEVFDAATPSGNSTMAYNLKYLGIVFERKDWQARSGEMVKGMWGVISRFPGSFGNWTSIGLEMEVGTEEIVITGSHFEEENKRLLSRFIPNKVFQSDTKEEDFPLLKGKTFEEPHWVYRCKNYSCSSPVKTVAELDL